MKEWRNERMKEWRNERMKEWKPDDLTGLGDLCRSEGRGWGIKNEEMKDEKKGNADNADCAKLKG